MLKRWRQTVTLTDIVVWAIGLAIGIGDVYGSIQTIRAAQYTPQQWINLTIDGLKSAFADYVQFLKVNPRYGSALANGANAGRFADSLQAAGYATDPGYAGKLRSIISSPRFNDLVGQLKNSLRLPTL